MTKKDLNYGSRPNDRSGEDLRTTFQKINDNFEQLYRALGDGNELGISKVAKTGLYTDIDDRPAFIDYGDQTTGGSGTFLPGPKGPTGPKGPAGPAGPPGQLGFGEIDDSVIELVSTWSSEKIMFEIDRINAFLDQIVAEWDGVVPPPPPPPPPPLPTFSNNPNAKVFAETFTRNFYTQKDLIPGSSILRVPDFSNIAQLNLGNAFLDNSPSGQPTGWFKAVNSLNPITQGNRNSVVLDTSFVGTTDLFVDDFKVYECRLIRNSAFDITRGGTLPGNASLIFFVDINGINPVNPPPGTPRIVTEITLNLTAASGFTSYTGSMVYQRSEGNFPTVSLPAGSFPADTPLEFRIEVLTNNTLNISIGGTTIVNFPKFWSGPLPVYGLRMTVPDSFEYDYFYIQNQAEELLINNITPSPR